jgi:hypothetical protein
MAATFGRMRVTGDGTRRYLSKEIDPNFRIECPSSSKDDIQVNVNSERFVYGQSRRVLRSATSTDADFKPSDTGRGINTAGSKYHRTSTTYVFKEAEWHFGS